MVELSETDKAYIAGLFDGEGSVGYYFRKRAHSVVISLVNTNFQVLPWLLDRIPVGTLYTRKRGTWKESWEISIRKVADVVIFLSTIRPYLIIKADQVDLLLSHLSAEQEIYRANYRKLPDHIIARRFEIDQKLRELKTIPTKGTH